MFNERSSPEYENYLLVPKSDPLVAQAANFVLQQMGICVAIPTRSCWMFVDLVAEIR